MTEPKMCSCARSRFGLTDDIWKGGYIMPDGKLLDLSDGEHIRIQEHAIVHECVDGIEPIKGMEPPEEDVNEHDEDEKRMQWMNDCRAIRISSPTIVRGSEELFRVESIHKPTVKQTQRLVESVKVHGSFYGIANRCPTRNVSRYYLFLEPSENDCLCITKKKPARPLDVHTWINKCWR
jgi:hypothetical protein